MSTCTKWADNIVITCANWGEQASYECTEWADEGSEACSAWADEGQNECCTWWPCSWACDAFYWVAKWVCLGWYWLAKWVCKGFAWIVTAVCTVFSWVVKLVCKAWDTLKCALLAILRYFLKRKAAPRIEHIFVLMLENRSFDHMLGFSRIDGTDAVTGKPTTTIRANPAVDKNLDPNTGMEVPVSQPADYTLQNLDKDPGHEFPDTLTVLCGKGAVYDPVPGGYPPISNSGFIQNYIDSGSTTPDRIMHCYAPHQLPVINALATEFAICDQWFSSLPGPTWPNRFFLLAATSGGLDGSPSSWDVATSSIVDGYTFDNGNIFDLLDNNCINWSIYEGDDFPVSFALNGMNLNELQGRFKDLNDFNTDVNDPGFSDTFTFIEPRYGSHVFDITGPGDFTCGNSMHPLDDVTMGEKLIKQVYESIRNSPIWEKSMLLVTFDEHGGFYDHVAPPKAVPPGDNVNDDYVQFHFKFDQLGVRVPAIVISPFIKKGIIDHTTFDHTSMLATTEKLLGISNLTMRDKQANDYLHLFSLPTARTDAPVTLPDAAISGHKCSDDEKDESKEKLLATRSELIKAKANGVYRAQALTHAKPTDAQFNFAHVALRKVLGRSEYPERKKWIEEFKNVKTQVDAAIFMTEAKLKIKHAVDVKKMMRESDKAQKLAAIRNKYKRNK